MLGLPAGASVYCVLKMYLLLLLLITGLTTSSTSPSGYKFMQKLYYQCSYKSTLSEAVKCIKIQGLKVLDKALFMKKIQISDGVSLALDPQAQSLHSFQERELSNMTMEEIDELLVNNTSKFMESRSFQISVPQLVEEGRRRGGGKHHALGSALLWALAIKGSFLAMAYKGIAVMSGTALIVGKLALMLSAILGLKKLVNGGHDKTTVEIVKIPKHEEVHTHSSSHDDDYHRAFYVGEQPGNAYY